MVGDLRVPMSMLAAASMLSGFIEAVLLAILAETAVTIAGGQDRAHARIGPVHLHAPIDTLLAVALVLVVVRLFLQVPLSVLPSRISSQVQARMRRDLFDAFSRACWDVQARDREGQVQETMTGQVGQATAALQFTMGLVTATLFTAVMMAFAIVLNAVATACVVVIALLLVGLLRPLRRLGAGRARALSGAQVHYAGGIAESIRVAEEAQVFGTGAAQRREVGDLIASTREHTYATQALLKLSANLYSALIAILFIGALLAVYELGSRHAASLGAVILILLRASTSGQNVQAAYQGLIQAIPFVERTRKAELRYRQGAVSDGTQRLTAVRALSFEHVGYAYEPGRQVLSDISFEVHAGEAVGIIGPSGAGKLTLVQLLLALRAPDQGRYLVNTVPVHELASADWHRLVAYVPQEPRLLHASVADNIRYFREGLDDAAVERAGRLARIHDDVTSWPNGYQTVVGPRADAVSGGQQQRICLARALVGRPQMLVLDEPTSALDPNSERLIQESLVGLKHELTLFVVAHRMSTLEICDRIMIILDGKLAAFDTIDYLSEHNHYYRSASKLATGALGGSLP